MLLLGSQEYEFFRSLRISETNVEVIVVTLLDLGSIQLRIIEINMCDDERALCANKCRELA